MLRSTNLKVWMEMDADYRAVAQRAVMAAPDARHAWVATDTGMILALTDEQRALKRWRAGTNICDSTVLSTPCPQSRSCNPLKSQSKKA